MLSSEQITQIIYKFSMLNNWRALFVIFIKIISNFPSISPLICLTMFFVEWIRFVVSRTWLYNKLPQIWWSVKENSVAFRTQIYILINNYPFPRSFPFHHQHFLHIHPLMGSWEFEYLAKELFVEIVVDKKLLVHECIQQVYTTFHISTLKKMFKRVLCIETSLSINTSNKQYNCK